MRIAFIILMAITTSGCISADYKSGSYWVLDEKSQPLNNSTTEQCESTEIKTNNAIASSSQIIAPYFIPLFHLSGYKDKEIIITIKNQSCPNFLITADGNINLPYTASSTNSEHCKIRIAQPKHADRITIKALNPKIECDEYTVALVKKSFFCVRQTKFGGSTSCKKAL
ncbi:hypothetical protein [Pseudomonas sp. sia0905]|uniref:hypothetical protein n=1 Tax=Pseudomonas sp. sia0905 TaxID=2854783 RepID=UPI001C495D5B|nr:hypothetical protein [Pseudomonas sp. sia0905]